MVVFDGARIEAILNENDKEIDIEGLKTE